MTILLYKSLHLVSMVAWFAGLFYLIRLFVYHEEALEAGTSDSTVLIKQYAIMEERLFRIIVRPAMGFTWIFGLLLIYSRGWDWFKESYWLHLKLLLVFMLSGYTEHNANIIKRLISGQRVMSSFKFRLYNEVPTLFLLAIVLLAVFKNLLNFGYTFGAIILVALVFFFATKWYRGLRLKNKK